MMIRRGGLPLLVALPSLCCGAAPVWAQQAQGVAGAAAAPVLADGVTAQMMFTQAMRFDSNPRMTTGQAQALWGSETSPEVTLSDDTPTSHVSLDSKTSINEYNQPALSSRDEHASLTANENWDRWQLSAVGHFDYDTTRTSELTSAGINLAGVRHTGVGVAPQATYMLDEADRVSLGGSFTDSRYRDSQTYTNYHFYSAAPTYSHVFSPQDLGFFQVQFSRYETVTGTPLTVDQVQPMVGWTRSIEPNLTVTLSGGAEQTYYRFQTPLTALNSIETGPSYNVNVTYQGVQDTLSFNSGRQPSPTAAGAEAETTNVALSLTHNLTTRVQFVSDLLYQTSSYQTQVSSQKYLVSVTPRLLYKVTDTVSVRASYQFREEAIVNTSQIPSSSGVFCELIFSPFAWSVR